MNRLLSLLLTVILVFLLAETIRQGVPVYIPAGILAAFVLHGLIRKED